MPHSRPARTPGRSGLKSWARAAALLAAAPLAACSSGGVDRITTASIQSQDVAARHPIELANSRATLDVIPQLRRGALDDRSQAQIRQFAARIRPVRLRRHRARPAARRPRRRASARGGARHPPGAGRGRRARLCAGVHLSDRRSHRRRAGATLLRGDRGAHAHPLRPMAERPGLGLVHRELGEPALLEFRLRQPADARRPDRRPARPRWSPQPSVRRIRRCAGAASSPCVRARTPAPAGRSRTATSARWGTDPCSIRSETRPKPPVTRRSRPRRASRCRRSAKRTNLRP